MVSYPSFPGNAEPQLGSVRFMLPSWWRRDFVRRFCFRRRHVYAVLKSQAGAWHSRERRGGSERQGREEASFMFFGLANSRRSLGL